MNVKVFTFNPIQENTYLLFNEKGNAIIIDPGCFFEEEKNVLKKFIDENNLKPVQLLNTHCHLDHVFGNKFIHDTYGLELYIHPKEKMMLEYAPISGEQYGLVFENYTGNLHFIQEGDSIILDEEVLEIFNTPGHSPGHLSFYNRNQNFAVVGDVLFYESIGRTDLPLGNYDTLINSIEQKLYTLPNDTIIYNGHGQSTTIAHEKKHNPFIQMA